MRNCKEYLEKQEDGTYALVLRGDLCKESDILVPEGAEIAILDDEKLSFAKPVNDGDDVLVLDVGHDVDWDTTKWGSWDESIDYGFDVVWQRDQDEPFLTPETTLNDQYAEIEEVRQQSIEATLAERQSTYGSFEDVAFVTENIMSILAKVRPNGLQDLPNTHRMALYMIASKMARIVNGDFNFIESWHDISGYAKLIENELMHTDGATSSRVVYQVVKNGVLEDKNES